MNWEQELVNAQTDISRAVFEMNAPGRHKDDSRAVEPRYVMLCVAHAHHALMRAYVALEGDGVRPFSDRELKKWERTAA